MASILPRPRAFIASLFNSLHKIQTDSTNDPPPSNSLLAASPATRSLFLTLHCLFPTELLPALDLLDRRLVTRLIHHPGFSGDCSSPDSPSESTNPSDHPTNSATSATHPGTKPPSGTRSVYYVRSSRPRFTSRSRNPSTTTDSTATSYEVHPSAWNCTCAAFTFSAFSSPLSLRDGDADGFPGVGGAVAEAQQGAGEGEGSKEGTAGQEGEWRFGGLTREWEGMPTPVCKHLLACVLVERCAGLGVFAEERVVGRGEMAGEVGRGVA